MSRYLLVGAAVASLLASTMTASAQAVSPDNVTADSQLRAGGAAGDSSVSDKVASQVQSMLQSLGLGSTSSASPGSEQKTAATTVR